MNKYIIYHSNNEILVLYKVCPKQWFYCLYKWQKTAWHVSNSWPVYSETIPHPGYRTQKRKNLATSSWQMWHLTVNTASAILSSGQHSRRQSWWHQQSSPHPAPAVPLQGDGLLTTLESSLCPTAAVHRVWKPKLCQNLLWHMDILSKEKKQTTTVINNVDILPVTLRWVLLGGISAMRHCSPWAVRHIN